MAFNWGFFIIICAACLTNANSRNHNAGILDDLYEEDLTIATTTGLVRGGQGGKTVNKGLDIWRFRSIPFAEPPVGDFRFEPPVPKNKWSGVLDVRGKGKECLQGSDPVIGSEDCLYLKIYTTTLPKLQKKLPVMVWIYGGAFFMGSPDFTEHTVDNLLEEGVIVASFHYRVGTFGFLSTGDLVVPGNAGLKDQVLALKWIKNNIEKFGGDPKKITLFGQSAGGASISYLLQSNLTKGLFDGVIMQSGSSLCQWSLVRDPISLAKSVAKELKVSTASTAKMVKGLKQADAEKLQQVSSSLISSSMLKNNPLHGLPIGPVIEKSHDGAILTGYSHQLLSNGQFHQTPIMIGHTSLEALVENIEGVMRIWLMMYDADNSRLVPASMNVGSITAASLGRSIKSEYFGSRSIWRSTNELMKFVSDDQWERPAQEDVRLYSAKTNVYYYQFSHMGPLFGVKNRSVEGVGHTEDLGYIFDFGYTGSQIDYLVRNRMVRMWTNFAKTGSPTPAKDPLLQNIKWIPNHLGDKNINRLEINSTLSMSVNPNANNMQFWVDIFERRGIPPYSTF